MEEKKKIEKKIKPNIKRPFRSLRSRIAVLFIGLLLLTMLCTTLVNMLFLEKYYISRKTKVILQALDELEELPDVDTDEDTDLEDIESEIFSDGDIFLEDDDDLVNISEELQSDSAKNNLSWVVITPDNQQVAHVGDNKNQLQEKVFAYVYDLDQFNHGDPTILKKTDQYTLQKNYDRFSGMYFLECWGSLSNGNYFLIRTPLESIQKNVKISNSFYLYVGIVIIIISGILIGLLTKKLTEPISELTDLSERMAHLDFEARYDSETYSEIDILGDNFNTMSDQLEHTISELKAANIRLQEDIEDKIKIDEMRKEFLDNVSHELKTPIALIQGYAEGLKEDISDDPESTEFYIDVIMDEAKKMNKLVRSLLTLNQLESGKDSINLERFDIVPLITGVIASMQIMIEQKGAKLCFDQTKPVYVWADEFKIEEVLTNYLSNALNHLEGDLEIEIRIHNLEDGRVKITVFNTGNPIAEEDIEKLWIKFYKVDKARTREYGGSGIGLSIVKAIMENHGQEYGVTNYDNGVEFWFTLDCK